MPVQVRKIPELANILIRGDTHDIEAAFTTTMNVAPTAIYAAGSDLRGRMHALLFEALNNQLIDEFLAEVRTKAQVMAAEIDEALGHDDPCPTMAVFINNRLPFMDRASLRARLRDMIKPDAPEIVVIEGPEASGKSYSAHLIGYVGDLRAAADVALVKLKDLVSEKVLDEATPELEPFELMEYICDQLVLPFDERLRKTRAQDTRILQKLLNWFVGAYKKRPHQGQRVWFVIDDLNFAGCPPWVAEFAAGLGERLTNNQLPDATIFLIGLDPARLSNAVSHMCEKEPVLPLTQDDTWDFIVRAAAERGKVIQTSGYGATIAKVWEGFSPPLKHEQVEEITRRAVHVVNNL